PFSKDCTVVSPNSDSTGLHGDHSGSFCHSARTRCSGSFCERDSTHYPWASFCRLCSPLPAPPSLPLLIQSKHSKQRRLSTPARRDGQLWEAEKLCRGDVHTPLTHYATLCSLFVLSKVSARCKP